MDTKLKADIAESIVVTELLKRGLSVLKPYGDRLPYDLAMDNGDKILKIQIKSAWVNKAHKRFIVDARRTKTNRRRMLRKYYSDNDFDFAIIHIPDLNDFYIIPVGVFTKFRSSITLATTDNKPRQRKPATENYKNRWDLLMGSSFSNK